MLKEFKAFVMRGNVVDLAVGVVIGGAFGTIVSSLVADIIMPPIGLLLGKVDFSNLFVLLKASADMPGPYATLADAQAAGGGDDERRPVPECGDQFPDRGAGCVCGGQGGQPLAA